MHLINIKLSISFTNYSFSFIISELFLACHFSKTLILAGYLDKMMLLKYLEVSFLKAAPNLKINPPGIPLL